MPSQTDTEPDNKLKDISKYLSQLILILVSIYLICIPLGRIKKESKFELVDVGIIMVLLIGNSTIIERVSAFKLGKDGIEATREKKVEKVEEEVKKVQKDIEYQNNIDFEAMRYMDLQLSDATSPSNPTELGAKILEASPIAVEYIYQRAKDVRHNVTKENRQRKFENKIKGMLERTIPLFQALTESRYGKKCPRYHAQLGYACKDYALEDEAHPKISELRDARDSLDKAIKLWQIQNNNSPSPPSLYCFNWAECDAKLPEISLLKLEDIQWRIKSAATLCKDLKGDNFGDIKSKMKEKYDIDIPKDFDTSTLPCRSAATLLG